MHFREHVISAKSKFLALTHVLVYGYWCCHATMLSNYNASVMFLLRYYQCIAMLWFYQFLIILANQVSGLFDERYLKKEYICTILIFSMQIDMETKKQTENLLMLNTIIPKAYKKWSRNGKSEVFKKL